MRVSGTAFGGGHRNSLAWLITPWKLPPQRKCVIAKTRSPNARRARCPEGEIASGSLILRRFSSGFFAEIEQGSQK